MRTTIFIRVFSAFAFMFLFAAAAPMPVHALGLSPPTVEINSLLRGTTQTRSVHLYRAPDDVGDVYIHVEPDKHDADFFVLDKTDVVMLNGQNEIEYTFGVTPGSAPNGDYELRLRFLKTREQSDNASGAGVSVVTGVTAQVLVTVGGEQHLEYTLDSILVGQTEEGLGVPVTYVASNSGNVDWQPQKITFAFFNDSGERVGEYTVSGNDIETVQAGRQRQSFTLSVPVDLARGAYTVSATFYDNDETAGTLSSGQAFDVFAPGTLEQSGTLKGLSVNKSTFFPGEKVKISAVFENGGETELSAFLVAEISSGNEILDLLRGSEYTIPAHNEFVFTDIFDGTREEGDYSVSAYVEYASKRTASMRTDFSVRGQQNGVVISKISGAFIHHSFFALILFAVLIIAMTFLFIAFKRKKRKEYGNAANIVLPPESNAIGSQTSAQFESSDIKSDHSES